MGKLPSPTREALLVAALAAEPTLELVSAVTGGDASATVAEAVEANLVQLEDGRVRFTHPLQFLPYQYEGFEPMERQVLRSNDIAMRLIDSGVPVDRLP